MPRFAANLTMMFNEVPFLERFAAAKAEGFGAVEFLFPYEHDAREIGSRLSDAGLIQVLFNTPPGDWNAGERGLAALPERRDDFRRAMDLALSYARSLACPRIHVMSGIVPAHADRDRYRACYVENLAWASVIAKKDGIALLVEPLNTRDMPGYLISSIGEARSVMADVGAGNVELQFDIYHTQMSQGFVAETFRENFSAVGHIQIAGVPGRHEPDERQEINYPYLFDLIDELGYGGWIGCEYRPRAGTADGLGWLKSVSGNRGS
jgi:hydroxypyruvate isomerase